MYAVQGTGTCSVHLIWKFFEVRSLGRVYMDGRKNLQFKLILILRQVSTIYACSFGIKAPDRDNRRCVCAAGELFLVSGVGGQQGRFECEMEWNFNYGCERR